MAIDITPPCLVPGIFNDDYHAAPGLSSSQIKALDRSAAHFDVEYGPLAPARKSTPQMDIGTIVHSLMEGAVDIEQLVAVPPKFNARTKEGKAAKSAWFDENKNKIILSQEELDRAMDMADALKEDEDVMQLLEGAELELSGWWTDPKTGLLLKCRPDILRRDIQIIGDWKTCEDATAEQFIWTAKRFRYYLSAAHYRNGLAAIDNGLDYQFVWICIESKPPYGIKLYWAERPGIQECSSRIETALQRYKEGISRNDWPKYEFKIEPLPYRRW